MRAWCKQMAAWAAAASMVVAGCGDDSSDPGGGAAAGGSGVGGGSGAGGTFDPDDPGVHVFVTLGAVFMLGQPMELAAAGFQPTAREDFDPEPGGDDIPIDTCAVAAEQPNTASCAGAADCSPEQDCLPDNDNDGNPVPGTEHCVTPRELMDVGPLTVEGFAAGPMDLTYNAGQSGAYTAPGTDGTLPAGTLAFDTTYAFHGAGDSSHGVGPFAGELYLAAALELTSPPLVELGMPGLMGIQANEAQDLTLQWSGSSAGELSINLVGGGEGGASIDCRVTDDGSFVVPAAMVQAAGLAAMAFLNMVTITREGKGTVSGDGVTFHAVDALQTLIINVQKAP